MNIQFLPLQEVHFPLLLKWLETPHVKAWWDQDVVWTQDLIQEKYGPYVQGYKNDNGVKRALQAYIILADTDEIGYIQCYNVYDFPRSEPLVGFPASLAALDVFIGEENFLQKGVGTAALQKFLEEYIDPYYQACFVDPNINNVAAIKTYENAGFKKVRVNEKTQEVFMLRERLKLSIV